MSTPFTSGDSVPTLKIRVIQETEQTISEPRPERSWVLVTEISSVERSWVWVTGVSVSEKYSGLKYHPTPEYLN